MEDRSGRLILVALVAVLGFALIIGFAFWPGAEEEIALGTFSALDPSFGVQGSTRLDLEHDERIVAVEALTDGRIALICNLGSAAGRWTPAVAMLSNDGSLSEEWGEGGLVRLTLGRDARAQAATQQPDGSIVLVGDIEQPQGSGRNLFVARIAADGFLDPAFDGDGWIEFDHGHGDQRALDVVALADGRLLVVGWARMADENEDMALLRLHADGRLDTSFGSGGLQTMRHGIRSREQRIRSALVVERGEIVALGEQREDAGDPPRAAAGRFLSAGQADPTFGDRGHRADYMSDPDGSAFTKGIVDASGAVLAGGRLGPAWTGAAGAAPASRFRLLRLMPTGEVDRDYRGGELRIGVDGQSLGVLDLAALADGRTMALTGVWDGAAVRPLLLALRPEGRLDREFAEDGRALVEVAMASSSAGMALQALDDRPLLAVEVDGGDGGRDVWVARLAESPTFGE